MSEVMQHESSTAQTISMTEAAIGHILAYLGKQKDSRGVRLAVKKTGCSGLSYVVDYVKEPQANDVVQAFVGEYHIYIDRQSYPYLKGMRIDYVRQGLNHKFVFDNPNQKGQCGCGESFTVE